MKKIRGIGIAKHRVDLGVRMETWADGDDHEVRAIKGRDRKIYIRFSPKPCISINGREYPDRRKK